MGLKVGGLLFPTLRRCISAPTTTITTHNHARKVVRGGIPKAVQEYKKDWAVFVAWATEKGRSYVGDVQLMKSRFRRCFRSNLRSFRKHNGTDYSMMPERSDNPCRRRGKLLLGTWEERRVQLEQHQQASHLAFAIAAVARRRLGNTVFQSLLKQEMEEND